MCLFFKKGKVLLVSLKFLSNNLQFFLNKMAKGGTSKNQCVNVISVDYMNYCMN